MPLEPVSQDRNHVGRDAVISELEFQVMRCLRAVQLRSLRVA